MFIIQYACTDKYHLTTSLAHNLFYLKFPLIVSGSFGLSETYFPEIYSFSFFVLTVIDEI